MPVFNKVTSLPPTLAADTFYFVENANFAESYLTDGEGVAKAIGNTAMIEAVAGPLIASSVADMNQVEVVADIAARDALTSDGRNHLALVLDASADPSVEAGAALYAYQASAETWIKVAEYESMDVSLTWAAIQGRPSSAPSLIDAAVNDRHTHANKATLDKLGENASGLTFEGANVGGSGGSEWATVDW